MKPSCHVKKGDEVEIIAGNHKGKRGTVLEVRAAACQVVVEGARKITKAVRKSEQHPQGGLIERDGPIHASNVRKIS